ncbi:MAG: hypothetical protein NC921_03970 [Candidatus Omnitrophica bacterium]|nr:hypothetical protein [Candidatus Omnitrophota bacterium]
MRINKYSYYEYLEEKLKNDFIKKERKFRKTRRSGLRRWIQRYKGIQQYLNSLPKKEK